MEQGKIWVIEYKIGDGTWITADDDGAPWVYLSRVKAQREAQRYSRIAENDLPAIEYRAVPYVREEESGG